MKLCVKVVVTIFVILNSLSGQDFKVIGFLPHYRFHLVDEIDFSAVTHVNLAFANPDVEGNLSFEGADIEPIVTYLHDLN